MCIRDRVWSAVYSLVGPQVHILPGISGQLGVLLIVYALRNIIVSLLRYVILLKSRYPILDRRPNMRYILQQNFRRCSTVQREYQ